MEEAEPGHGRQQSDDTAVAKRLRRPRVAGRRKLVVVHVRILSCGTALCIADLAIATVALPERIWLVAVVLRRLGSPLVGSAALRSSPANPPLEPFVSEIIAESEQSKCSGTQLNHHIHNDAYCVTYRFMFCSLHCALTLKNNISGVQSGTLTAADE